MTITEGAKRPLLHRSNILLSRRAGQPCPESTKSDLDGRRRRARTPPDVSMSRLSRFDSIWALWRPGAHRTSRCLDCLDSIRFGASEGPNPAGRLDVSIVSIRFDLGPLAAWGPPDVSMSRLSRFDSIWGLRGPEPRRTSRCLDCLDSAGFGASRPAGIGIYGIWHTISVSLSYPFARLT